MKFGDFIIGKKYKDPSWKGQIHVTCVAKTATGIPIVETSRKALYKITQYSDWFDFVEVRKPREFWIWENPHLSTVKTQAPDIKTGWIHVREVLENEK